MREATRISIEAVTNFAGHSCLSVLSAEAAAVFLIDYRAQELCSRALSHIELCCPYLCITCAEITPKASPAGVTIYRTC